MSAVMTDFDTFDDARVLDAETWDCPRRLTLEELREADGVDLRQRGASEEPEDYR